MPPVRPAPAGVATMPLPAPVPLPPPTSTRLRAPAPACRQVNGLTIRLLLAKDKNWTRALKHMLVDLKFVLKVGGHRGHRGQGHRGEDYSAARPAGRQAGGQNGRQPAEGGGETTSPALLPADTAAPCCPLHPPASVCTGAAGSRQRWARRRRRRAPAHGGAAARGLCWLSGSGRRAGPRRRCRRAARRRRRHLRGAASGRLIRCALLRCCLYVLRCTHNWRLVH